MNDALRVKLCELSGWRNICSVHNYGLLGFPNGGASVPKRLPQLTLDWLHALRESFTEMQQDRYHSELCTVIRPNCSCNIVSTWDMIQATAEQHAQAYIATLSK